MSSSVLTQADQTLSIGTAVAQSSLLNSDSAILDVELILCHILDCSRSYLRTWPDKILDSAQQQAFSAMLAERIKGRPIAHLLGQRDFWSLDLKVTENTLIPRPDTEVLVECALELPLKDGSSVLDLGTGTGAIALALAAERRHWHITGVDRFSEVVDLAKENAKRNDLEHVQFLVSDWFSALANEQYHLIVSNPPYIDINDLHLSQGDVRFEPESALVAENSGMADIEFIAREARQYLTVDAWLVFEHSYDQGLAVREVLQGFGYRNVDTRQDYGSNDRVTLGQWPN